MLNNLALREKSTDIILPPKVGMKMGRVFTINFQFEEQPASALVCLHEKDYNILFRVHLLDESLLSILPQGKLEFSFVDGLKTPLVLLHKKAQSLVSCIANEILHHFNHEALQDRTGCTS